MSRESAANTWPWFHWFRISLASWTHPHISIYKWHPVATWTAHLLSETCSCHRLPIETVQRSLRFTQRIPQFTSLDSPTMPEKRKMAPLRMNFEGVFPIPRNYDTFIWFSQKEDLIIDRSQLQLTLGLYRVTLWIRLPRFHAWSIHPPISSSKPWVEWININQP